MEIQKERLKLGFKKWKGKEKEHPPSMAGASPDRTVSASPPFVGGSDSATARPFRAPTTLGNVRQNSATFFVAKYFASQSPYSGCKNFANGRDVRRHFA
jgi:hypothetical protein